MEKSNLLYRVLAIVVVYAMLKFFGGSFGQMALYPVTLLVTFLHEFGHALGALLTGGKVAGLNIAADGSGYTTTVGGNRAVILMGGYLGSAVLGNLLFLIGARQRQLTQVTLLVLAGLMVLTALFWFESFQSTGLLVGFALVLGFIALKTEWDRDVLMFLGLAAVLYIIQDFRVGPSSDLAMYEQTVGLFPAQVWMYLVSPEKAKTTNTKTANRLNGSVGYQAHRTSEQLPEEKIKSLSFTSHPSGEIGAGGSE